MTLKTIDDIPTHWDAAYKDYEVKDIARYLEATYYLEYWVPGEGYLRGQKPIFTHYFNERGREVLVCCNAMNNTIQMFDKPREWGNAAIHACQPRTYLL